MSAHATEARIDVKKQAVMGMSTQAISTSAFGPEQCLSLEER
jgi:hypothetical protein